ncbi:hypothetical protein GGR50DRAFT_693626 [Xylaria sp. CBS 124048]|nr:hypothetical protein GGR50DRAFT_693626 [Xylaria sp. CBS 124048]
MRLIYQYHFLVIPFLFLWLQTVDHAAAWHIPGLPQVRGSGSPARVPPPASPQTPDRSFLRRLFDHFSSTPLSYASASGSLGRWVDNHPKLVESLKEYDDQVVIRFNISTARDEAALRTVVDRMLLDVWDFTNSHVDIRVPTRRVRFLTRALPWSLWENHSILIPDLARAIAATYPSQGSLPDSRQLYDRGITPTTPDSPQRQGVVDAFFQDYQPYSVIVAWMRLIDSMFRGRGRVELFSIGKSYEGRDIPALRLGIHSDEDTSGQSRKIILVTGGFHGREWISISSVNYVAWSFIQSLDRDPMINEILKKFDLVFIPVLNPDGYDYTWEVDRLWRKSRQRTKMSYCRGLDLDHSFSYQWNSIDQQSEPCSESYGGDEPLQAVEAAQLADWARNETDRGFKFVAYLDLHSYSQQVLVPYSFSCDVQPPNLENLEEVAMNLAKHMRLSKGETYTMASACEGAVTPSAGRLVETRGGSAIDYFFHELGAHYSYQIKLRDTGSYGFLLPSDNIIPTGEEVLHAMKYLGDFLLGNNGREFAGEASPADGHIAQAPITEDDEDMIMELRKR